VNPVKPVKLQLANAGPRAEKASVVSSAPLCYKDRQANSIHTVPRAVRGQAFLPV